MAAKRIATYFTSITGALMFVALIDVVACSSGHHWAYTGEDDPVHWYNHYAKCRGIKQSPIDIDPSSASPQNFAALHAVNYDTRNKTMTAMNNGHTVMISLPKRTSKMRLPYIKDGGLPNQFIFSQAHFHWGRDSSRGSEHTIHKKSYAAEIHFVHFNKKYGSIGNAISHSDGLAVLGVFVQIANNDNPAFEPLISALKKMDAEVHETPIDKHFSLHNLLPNSMEMFYRYSGSLTTPACDEIVIWTVFDQPISMSEKQLEQFRKLKTDDGDQLANNYRPLQPLQGRTVYVRSNLDSTKPRPGIQPSTNSGGCTCVALSLYIWTCATVFSPTLNSPPSISGCLNKVQLRKCSHPNFTLVVSWPNTRARPYFLSSQVHGPGPNLVGGSSAIALQYLLMNPIKAFGGGI